MKVLFFVFVFLIGLLFSGCATVKVNKGVSVFSGKFSCPAYKGEDNEWGAHEQNAVHKVVNGVDIIVTEPKGKKEDIFDKMGPYKNFISIIDGMWRYGPFYRNKTLYPVKVKYEKLSDNKITWQAEYPDYIDNKGIKRLARTGKGTFWIDKNGDKISTASHFTGQYKCKRIK